MAEDNYEKLPKNSTKVWRYISVAKLLSILHTKSIYFSRADQFSDIFEGAFTKGSLDYFLKNNGIELSDNLIKLAQWVPSRSFVSCWHLSEFESMALWNTYGAQEGALALQSTVGRLKNTFPDEDDQLGSELISQEIVRIQYIDYKTEHPRLDNLAGPLYYKRKAFSYENEIRVIRIILPSVIRSNDNGADGKAINMGAEPLGTGLNISVNISDLIEKIYIAPGAPGFILSAVRETLQKFDLSIPCVQSDLDEIPEFSRNDT